MACPSTHSLTAPWHDACVIANNVSDLILSRFLGCSTHRPASSSPHAIHCFVYYNTTTSKPSNTTNATSCFSSALQLLSPPVLLNNVDMACLPGLPPTSTSTTSSRTSAATLSGEAFITLSDTAFPNGAAKATATAKAKKSRAAKSGGVGLTRMLVFGLLVCGMMG